MLHLTTSFLAFFEVRLQTIASFWIKYLRRILMIIVCSSINWTFLKSLLMVPTLMQFLYSILFLEYQLSNYSKEICILFLSIMFLIVEETLIFTSSLLKNILIMLEWQFLPVCLRRNLYLAVQATFLFLEALLFFDLVFLITSVETFSGYEGLTFEACSSDWLEGCKILISSSLLFYTFTYT